jgi:uncharacterized membrane protein YhaH (DUF805 family)
MAGNARKIETSLTLTWWFLVTLTIIGNIWLIVWWCTKGTAGRNRFGTDPLGAK